MSDISLFDRMKLWWHSLKGPSISPDTHLYEVPSTLIHGRPGEPDHAFMFRPYGEMLGEYYSLEGESDLIAINLCHRQDSADEVALSIVKTQIHELTHWAIDGVEEHPDDAIEHAVRWNSRIVEELNYVHEDIELEYNGVGE